MSMDARLLIDTNMEATTSYLSFESRFEDLYLKEYPALYAVALALVGAADGEDLVQDTMFKALVNWERVGRLERPGGWCHRVLINLCRTWWRHARAYGRALARLGPVRASDPEPSAEAVAFWSAVRDLPSRPRMVVALYYGADRSTADIASILAVPEGTVCSDLSRARVVLAKQLKG